MTEREALLVLNAVPDLGAVRIRKLMALFGGAQAVLGAGREQLALSKLLSLELVTNILNFSKDKFLQDEYNLMQRKGIVALTAVEENFPGSLNGFDDAPVVLYLKGRMEVLHQPSVALVGSRAASFYGCRSAKFFARTFVEAGLTVVSGLARGIDTASHQGALEADGTTVAVIGCGFNHMYPKENIPLMERISSQGCVVSEFAFSMPPLKHNFPWRNRIISGLSRATVVIEAGLRSGALITADYAQAQHKDVFVLPSNIDNEHGLGSNQLIRDGACMALTPDDVLARIMGEHRPFSGGQDQKVVLLSDEQSRVYPCIGSAPVHLDELVQETGFDISRLINIALSLELKHLIRQLPGQYYVRK
ncbi:MAG: DNA-processing protein DprA [Candidatus Omnitrophica bacterium]|nr:DNA-processing protein DprA [Candidatus Omnitrophota bacterium]